MARASDAIAENVDGDFFVDPDVNPRGANASEVGRAGHRSVWERRTSSTARATFA